MIPIPAIDLKNRKVVRLFQGNFKEEKVYPEKPEVFAKSFEEQGALRLHVVDLDGALLGKPKNTRAIEQILKKVGIPIQVGGGIRDLKTIEAYLALGVSWVVLGTQACLDKGFTKEALNEFKNKVLIGIDAQNGWVMTQGWTVATRTQAMDLAKTVRSQGATTIIYTDIARDGALTGPPVSEIEKMCGGVDLELIASGGVATLEDVSKLANLRRNNLLGVIIGKALYENQFTLREAIQACLPSA